MQINDIMTADPACCRSETPLHEVAKLMLERDCGALPVVAGDEQLRTVIGVITDRDIATRHVAARRDPDQAKACDAMTHPAAVVSQFSSIEEGLRLMTFNQVRRLPVVDHAGVLVGMISQADIARHIPAPEVGALVSEVSKGFDQGHG